MAQRTRITLPNNWQPRPYQLPLWRYLEEGGRRAVAVWHRRAGKDLTVLNFTSCAAHRRIGTYWHMLPEAKQARKAIWDGLDREGRRIIDQVFPKEIRRSTNSTEMQIKLRCGSVWQVVGSDNYDSLVGTNPVGVVFSEYSLARPAAWDYIRPILAENGGWAAFIYTPRGKNHGKRMYDMARRTQGWFCELLRASDTGVITPDMIEEERLSGMSDEMIEQEYNCSFEGAVEGSYYGKLLSQAQNEGRITDVPFVGGIPVNTFWDIGHADTTAIWFHQQVGVQHRFLYAYEASGESVQHFVALLQRLSMERGYVYGRHYLPHDAEAKTLASVSNKDGRSVRALLENLGLRDVETVQRIEDVMVGIDLTRAILPSCYFDARGCERGLDALGQYHKEWDETLLTFRRNPCHDWSSNYADAFRQFAQGYRPARAATSNAATRRSFRVA